MDEQINPKIVVIGGGTGSFTLLSGLKKYFNNLTALVSMADSGGSTGQLRDELGVLPPGDVRQCLVALAETPQMRQLFSYRFKEGSLSGHSFGNLFLTAVEKMTDNFTDAVKLASKILNVKGQVLPVTLDSVNLVATQPDGTVIRGEESIDQASLNRPHITLDPSASLTAEGRQAIAEADIVILTPGSLYGSLAAVMVVDGVAEALQNSQALKIYVCNLVTEQNQTNGFKVHDFAAEIERFTNHQLKLDYVVYNNHKPNNELLERYAREGEHWVEFDLNQLTNKHYRPVGDNLLADRPALNNSKVDVTHRTYIRHNPDKVAKNILSIWKNRPEQSIIAKMNCTKAIIPMAGYGTRRLPITKAIEKCMLPVGNRPVIDYVVEDCIRAGITEFIFVVGEEFDQIRRYYGQNQLLEDYLENKGKTKELEEVQALNKKARFHYVVQDQYQPYGTAVPLWLCRHLVKPDEKVLFVSGDQFFWREDGSSELTDFIKQAAEADTPSAMLANEVDWDTVDQYGIVVTKQRQDGKELYEKIIEKPSREEAPSNLNNSTCFIFDNDIFPFVERNIEQHYEGEHYVIDPVNEYAASGKDIAVVRAKGHYMDCGTTKAWLEANNRLLQNQ